MWRVVSILIASILAVAPASATTTQASTAEGIALPIIMYHATWPKRPNMYSVTPAQLEQDLQYLTANSYTTITVSDLVAFQEKGVPLPPKPIILTFDDGYVSNYLYAFPLLRKYNHKAIFSIVGKYTDDNYTADGTLQPTHSHLTYEQIQELHDSGLVEIQNHTYNLHRVTKARNAMSKSRRETTASYQQIIRTDLQKMHDSLYQRTGIACTAVVFPYGKYSPETIEVVRQLGYKAAFTCTAGTNYITPTSNLFLLKRVNRPSGRGIDAILPRDSV